MLSGATWIGLELADAGLQKQRGKAAGRKWPLDGETDSGLVAPRSRLPSTDLLAGIAARRLARLRRPGDGEPVAWPRMLFRRPPDAAPPSFRPAPIAAMNRERSVVGDGPLPRWKLTSPPKLTSAGAVPAPASDAARTADARSRSTEN